MISGGARVCVYLVFSAVSLRTVPVLAQALPVAPEMVAHDGAGHAVLRTTRIATPLQIDGRLDESIYQDVPPAGGFIQCAGPVQPPAGAVEGRSQVLLRGELRLL